VNEQTFLLRNSPIPYGNQYKHLGILCDNNLCMNPSIDEAVSKLRTTFYGILNCGLHSDGLIPPTLTTIYQTVVLPKKNYMAASCGILFSHRQCYACRERTENV
jgi:hypothetical protein